MSMVLEHGVFTSYRDIVPRPVTEVLSNAIALVGSAPIYQLETENQRINEPVRSLNDFEDARFAGSKTPGFTIPYALDAIRDNGGATVDFVNVFDPAIHKTDATEDATFSTDTVQLKRTTGDTSVDAGGLTAVSISGASVGVDYTIDAVNGRITRIQGGTISAGDTVSVTYSFADPSLITTAQVIGAVVNNVRTGMQAFRDLFNAGGRGYNSKILIAPGYSDDEGVAAEMEALSNELPCYFLIDAPVGATRDQAIAGRTGAEPVDAFVTANRRAILCYPRVFDSQDILQPLSQYVAGVMAGTDIDFGYWHSPSNKLIAGITGVELRLSGDYTNPNTDINALNQAGIVTVYSNGFGIGYRVWGNRAASYPTDTSPLNFIPVGRTLDITMESIQRASLPYVDQPISVALIDMILAGANSFIREQINAGALVVGSNCIWDKRNNLKSQLAAGVITFNVILMVPTPAETIRYESSLDIRFLDNILPTFEVAA